MHTYVLWNSAQKYIKVTVDILEVIKDGVAT